MHLGGRITRFGETGHFLPDYLMSNIVGGIVGRTFRFD